MILKESDWMKSTRTSDFAFLSNLKRAILHKFHNIFAAH